MRDNTLAGNLLQPLITMTRLHAVGNATQLARFQYLHGAAFFIDDPDNVLASARIDNPQADPYVGGPCDADVLHESLNNTVLVNGVQR